ncbi:cytochrome c oxidase assembly protein [Polymorphobacter sp.]|uniref:cytochrome c oxidase assembly protein n=1 Tax=Polymorphobacter sp. TaxID=1909290 RepID=UPI003F721CB8
MNAQARLERAKRRTGWLAAIGAVSMIGAAYAAVPLYRLFCQVTGYNGTVSRAEAEALPDAARLAALHGRTIKIRFDATTDAGLDWEFRPEKSVNEVKIGEKVLAYYEAWNREGTPVTGRAVYNVSPDTAGAYFRKIDCFCFTEQTLAGGERVRMPVVYFIDPAILDDPSANRISEITLSYTFYPMDKTADAALSRTAQPDLLKKG